MGSHRMGLNEFLLDEDRGVSPVIGIILMIAITVILAALIASFVMNADVGSNQPVNVEWDWSYDGSNVTLEHTGGENVKTEYFSIVGDVTDDLSGPGVPDTMKKGDTIDIDVSSASSGDELKLKWTDQEGESSNIVATYKIP